MKYLQIPVNASNLEKFPLFTPKFHPRLCWVILIIRQLQRTAIYNPRIYTIDMIDTINTIDRIDWKNQYEYNPYNQSDQLTLQTSPTQWHYCCFLFRFAWLINVRIIVVLKSSFILLVLSPLLHLLLLFDTRSYSGTHSICDTVLPTRNGLLLCISRSALSSWIYPTNIILLLCSRSYQLQQWGFGSTI